MRTGQRRALLGLFTDLFWPAALGCYFVGATLAHVRFGLYSFDHPHVAAALYGVAAALSALTLICQSARCRWSWFVYAGFVVSGRAFSVMRLAEPISYRLAIVALYVSVLVAHVSEQAVWAARKGWSDGPD